MITRLAKSKAANIGSLLNMRKNSFIFKILTSNFRKLFPFISKMFILDKFAPILKARILEPEFLNKEYDVFNSEKILYSY